MAASADGLSSVKNVDLPPQSLAISLKQLADQTGMQILFEQQAVAGIDAPALKARTSGANAFDTLLARTDLEYTTQDQTVAIRRKHTPALESGGALLFAQATPQPATAAEAPLSSAAATSSSASDETPAPVQEVVVTGSRLSAAFAAPTPVTAFSTAQLTQASPLDVATALAQIPSLSGSVLSQNAGAAGATAGTNGQSLLNLRGLGVNRTLVLLDGERLGTTNVSDSVDINIIPQSLLKRVDIVTGGASASYGSDAVAGVVNFVIDSNFQGFKADVSAGTTTYHDATNGKVSLAFGHAFGDNARFVGGFDYFRVGGVGQAPTGRDWVDNPYFAEPNPVAGGRPTTLVLPNGRIGNGTYGGLITAANGCTTVSCRALVNQQFGSGGALEPFTPGSYIGTSFASGGDGAYATFGVAPEIDRQNLFLHGEVDVSSGLTLFSTLIAARTHTELETQNIYETGTYALTIFPNNAYLPPAVASVFASNPSLTSITVGRTSADLGMSNLITDTKLGRLVLGAKGSINDRWSFDTSIGYQYTVNNLDRLNSINRNLYAAVDAVKDSNGQVVCNSTLKGYDAGCVPINLFGVGAPSAAAIDYVTGINRGDTLFKQTSFDANLRGDLGDNFTLGAGPISVAMGMSYRHDMADRTVDPLSAIYNDCTGLRGCPAVVNGRYGGYQSYNPAPLYGTTGATEGFMEFGIPLLKDRFLAKSLTMNVAGRMTDYTVSGYQDSWKLGLQWQAVNGMTLRATASQDIRAPDVLELFSTGASTLSTSLFPSSTAPQQVRASGLNRTVGNPNLEPEIAHTNTVGMVLDPDWAPGWQTSVDYYRIRIAHAIESLSGQGVIDGCYNGNTTVCRLITINGVPVTSTLGITNATAGLVITADTENVGREAVSGIDFESTYARHWGPGTFTTRVLANYLAKVDLPLNVSGCQYTSLVGAIGGCLSNDGYPRWRGSLSLQYDTSRYGLFVQERYTHGGRADPWDVIGVTINRNTVPSMYYTDLTLDYKLGFENRGKLYLNVTNLLNRDPPVTATRATADIQTTSFNLYDVLGRRFVLGYKVQW